jgi:uncharacterized protein (DUF362 family)
MQRREFFALGAAFFAQAPQQKKQLNESVTATATQDSTPRVGIVLSSFKEGEEHDGSKLKGLVEPQPPGAKLTDAQFDAMVRRAIELGDTRTGGLHTVVTAEDWVVIKTDIGACHGLGPEVKDGGAHSRYQTGAVTDPRVVRALVSWMAEHKCGARITIAEGSAEWLPMARSKSPTDGWNTTWGGDYGGVSYKSMVEDLQKKYPSIKLEIADLNFEDAVEMPVQGSAAASKNTGGMYYVPKTIQQCDKLISVSPFKTVPGAAVGLTVWNYLGIAPGSKYGFPKNGLMKLGDPNEIMVDLYSFHPADYAIAGGSFGIEGNPETNGATVHHNVVVAGLNAIAVDTVSAAIMGFEPSDLKFASLAEKRGFGGWDIVDLIWTRGDTIEQATRKFRRA